MRVALLLAFAAIEACNCAFASSPPEPEFRKVKACEDELIIDRWYRVKEEGPDFFRVSDAYHDHFYILRYGDQALFIDSGLGVASPAANRELFQRLGIRRFDVLLTHAHCDHVGLNPYADQVHIAIPEWLKYQAAEEKHQLRDYYEFVGEKLDWPEHIDFTPQCWKPTHWVHDRQHLSFGPYRVLAIATPGHTVGSFSYLVTRSNGSKRLFIGDLAHHGTLTLRHPDASLKAYKESLIKISTFLGLQGAKDPRPTGISVYAGHGQVPLHFNKFLAGRVISAVEKISMGQAPYPTMVEAFKNRLPHAYEFVVNHVHIQVHVGGLDYQLGLEDPPADTATLSAEHEREAAETEARNRQDFPPPDMHDFQNGAGASP